jgi:hypothetical protein
MHAEQQWYRDGATQQNFAMDQGQCQAQGFSIPGGNLMQTAIVFNSCMRGKGWELREATAQASEAPIGPTECVPSSTPGWITCRPK